MNDQELTQNSEPTRRRAGLGRTRRAGAVALAALASLTVAVGCGGGEESSEPELSLQQKLQQADFQAVNKYPAGDLKIPGAPAATEGYSVYDSENGDVSASVLAFESVEDAEAHEAASTSASSTAVLEDGTYISASDGIEQSPDSDAFLEQITEVVEN